MIIRELDTARAEAFAGRMLDVLNASSVALLLSVGHRTGLLDTLARVGAVTSEELAEEAGLVERYVREWLGGVVTGGVVEYDPQAGTYRLPPEHAACLTRAAAPDNLAVAAQFVSVLGAVEDDVVRCFREGGGVPYERYERFHEVMAEDSHQNVVLRLDQRVLPLAPGLEERLADGIDALDVGCGRGRALLKLAARFPASRFVGYDLSPEAIADATAAAAEQGLANVRFEARDVSELGEEGRYDVVFAFDAIHDQGHPDKVLRGIARALRPGGTFLMQDIRASSHLENNLEHPLGPFLYTTSCMHCMTVSLAQEGGQGLGTVWGEELALALLGEAGFEQAVVHAYDDDPLNVYFVCEVA